MPLGAVYRSVTLAVSAARGSVRYARAKDARDSVFWHTRVQYLSIVTRGKVSSMTERRYPPGEVCPVRCSQAARGKMSGIQARSYSRTRLFVRCAPVGPSAGIRPGKFVRYAYSLATGGKMSGIYVRRYSRAGLSVRYSRAQEHRRGGLWRPSSDRYLSDDQYPRKNVCTAPE